MAQPDYASLSDDELVNLCRIVGSKDDRPFSELFRRHRQHIWHIGYRFFANPEDAEDITQEVFFKAYRGLSYFEGRAAVKTWLHRIALNICLNELRARRIRPPLTFFALEELSETLPAVETQNNHVDQIIFQEKLRAVLAGVKAEDQEALYLREVEDYAFADIAELLGVGLSAAKMRVYRTRLALQKAITTTHEE